MNWNTKTLKKIKYSEIKQLLEHNFLTVKSNILEDEFFLNIKTISKSTKDDLSFFSNMKYLNDLNKIKAKACLIHKNYINYLPKNCEPIIVEDPYLALALLSNLFSDNMLKSNGIIFAQK